MAEEVLNLVRLENSRWHSSSVLSAGGGCVNMQTLLFSSAGTWLTVHSRESNPPTPPLSFLSPCDPYRCEKLQVSLMCLFWSISVTGRPCFPFVHRRREAGHAELNQTGPDQTNSSQASLLGLITRPCRSRRPGLRHWGHNPLPQEAGDKQKERTHIRKDQDTQWRSLVNHPGQIQALSRFGFKPQTLHI